MSEPGSKFESSSPSRPRPRSPVRTPTTRPPSTSSCSADVSGRIVDAERLGLVREEATELRDRRDPIAVVGHRRRRRDAHRAALRHEEHRLAVHLAEERQLRRILAPCEEPLQRPRVDDRAREKVRARRLSLLEHGDRHLAEPLRRRGILLDELAEPDRGGETRRAGADDQEPDVDALVDRIASARRSPRAADHGGGKSAGRTLPTARHEEARARTSSASFGTIACRSPTTPKSENSKIGAFGSLLMATITFEPCMPTLCWIAPEIPSAT